MARTQIYEVVQDTAGNAVSGALVQVNVARTATPVFVYTTEGGGGGSSGPVTTVNGAIPGWVEEGEYDLVCTNPSFTRRYNAIIGGNPALGNDSVTAAKIIADGVGSSEIGADTVGTSEIAPGAVTNTELGADAVNSAKIQAGTVDDTDLVSPNNGRWITIYEQSFRTPAAVAALTNYFASSSGVLVASGAAIASVALKTFPYTSGDYTVAGKATQIRLIGTTIVNATAPGAGSIQTFSFGTFTQAGGAANINPTVNTPACGATGPNTPAANSQTQFAGSPVSSPGTGIYTIWMNNVTVYAANCETSTTIHLQMRHV